ncbi:MAG TPA: hypothetical protein VKE41_18030 [Roseiflexaceae bacterium]|nr:hypothetical protein [Roseiflexaceae bacterium]
MLALAAILLLALSAELTHRPPHSPPLSPRAASATILYENTNAFKLSLMKGQALPSTAQHALDQDSPSLALLIYLGLIVVGSAVAVVLVHRRLHREM